MMGTMKAIWKLSREVHIMAQRTICSCSNSMKKETRIYHLPLGMRNKATGEMIGMRIGKLIATDESLDGRGWANFLRIRVEMDITKPLRRPVKLSNREGKTDIWGRVAYERLPTFCYRCGRLGYSDNDCEEKEWRKEESDGLNQYDDWLRASSLKKGITFDKENSSTTKMKAFWTQMKATPAQDGSTHGGSVIKVTPGPESYNGMSVTPRSPHQKAKQRSQPHREKGS
ncbi:hypothetical protein PTKIN_Ptkin16aG0078000 [Pterospermum kingtungense]